MEVEKMIPPLITFFKKRSFREGLRAPINFKVKSGIRVTLHTALQLLVVNDYDAWKSHRNNLHTT
jgi:hypothetical protein